MIAIEETPHPKLDTRQLDHRYDGIAKVTGRAKYAAEFPVENLAYAYIVQATIPAGTIASIDQSAATRAAGVYSIITPFNAFCAFSSGISSSCRMTGCSLPSISPLAMRNKRL